MLIFFRSFSRYVAHAFWALGLFMAIGPGWAQPLPANNTSNTGSLVELPDIIAGIIHYTRWPGHPDPVRLCLNEKDTDTAAISLHFEQGYKDLPRVLPLSRRLLVDAGDKLLDCNVVYFGKVNAKEVSALLIQLGRHPILTIGHGDDFCSYSGLFCLVPQPLGLRIGANLDSISRNGLRVNPLLLKLTARDRKGTP